MDHETARRGQFDVEDLHPLSEEIEKLIHETIGCCIAVHSALGPGLKEAVYSRSAAIELKARRIPIEWKNRTRSGIEAN